MMSYYWRRRLNTSAPRAAPNKRAVLGSGIGLNGVTSSVAAVIVPAHDYSLPPFSP